ncbi:efflux RND transporter periplasmic adaptor subunit [bacterium]|nr:efflux RND transporter periplasmic adaptor subunit [bacterium]
MLKNIKKFRVFIILGLIIIIGGAVSYKIFFSQKNHGYKTVRVEKRDIIQQVSATGQVKKGDKIDLGFDEPGKIERLYVEIGDEVEPGDFLIKLDTKQLSIQLNEAEATLNLAKAQLNKLLAGASNEEIEIAKTTVENASTALRNAEQGLENVKNQASEKLQSAYEDALNILDASYIKVSNAASDVNMIQKLYFNSNNQDSMDVKEQKERINNGRDIIKKYLDLAKEESTYRNIDLAIEKTEENLRIIYDALGIIREICDKPVWQNIVSSTYKMSLDNHKSYINSALTNVVGSKQNISLTKIANKANIDKAQAEVDSARGALKKAQDNLDLILAPPRQEDIDFYQAQVTQAQAKVDLLRYQINKSILKAPVKGEVVMINKEIGEQVNLGEPVLSLIPQDPFQIEIDVAEVDIGKVHLGDLAKITLDAFPEKEFSGKVVEIDPAETVIAGVVYYKTKVSLDDIQNYKIEVKPGMTASVDIITDKRENVLAVPSRAIVEKENKKFVRIPQTKGEYTLREVQTGLKGSEGYVEIISGLQEGEEIISFIEKK